jgi:hypothetical protein
MALEVLATLVVWSRQGNGAAVLAELTEPDQRAGFGPAATRPVPPGHRRAQVTARLIAED